MLQYEASAPMGRILSRLQVGLEVGNRSTHLQKAVEVLGKVVLEEITPLATEQHSTPTSNVGIRDPEMSAES